LIFGYIFARQILHVEKYSNFILSVTQQAGAMGRNRSMGLIIGLEMSLLCSNQPAVVGSRSYFFLNYLSLKVINYLLCFCFGCEVSSDFS